MKDLLLNSLLLLLFLTTEMKWPDGEPNHTTVMPGSLLPGQALGNEINNGFALQSIKNKVSRADSSMVMIKVLHIGDSHLKSGYFSQPFMEKLNAFYSPKYRGNLFFNFQLFCKTGTKYSDYNELAELDNQLTREKPDLVIISLGTNDAFSGSYRVKFYEKIDHLANRIKKLSPHAALLLTTPSDALKKDKQGIYYALPEMQFVTDVIVKYANDHQLAYWNLHQIMGGNYSINDWYRKKLAEPDRIHFTRKGYQLFADWLFQAFTACLQNNITRPYIFHL